MTSDCIFCKSVLTGKKSVEHIIPQWLLDELGIRKTEIEPSHMSPEKNLVSKRKHTLENLKAGKICRICNNGWVSSLEVEAKPILIDLMNVNKLVTELTVNERFILARWTFKTALTLNSGSNYHKNIPFQHFFELYENVSKLPERVFCFAQQHHANEKFYWLQWPVWNITSENITQETIENFKTKSYKISFQFKNLLLTVFYISEKEFIPVLWKGIHVTLYPKSGKCGWYESDNFEWKDSLKALTDFHVGIQAWQG